jgi:predicted phage terminase large subunit-like protein
VAKGKPDYVVMQAWGRRARGSTCSSSGAACGDSPHHRAAPRARRRPPGAYLKLIEDKANGPAIIDTLRSKVPGVLAVEPEGGKVARANAVSAQVEAGEVFLPHPVMSSWTEGYVVEHATFPNAANDDQVDCTTQALKRMLAGGAGTAAASLYD